MKTSLSRAAGLCALLATTSLASPAFAQTSAPTFRNLDANGVDLTRGDFLTSFPEGSVGSGEAALALLRMVGATSSSGSRGTSQWDNILLNAIQNNGIYVDFGSRSDKFPGAELRGATLSGSGTAYEYRAPDGTVIDFTDQGTGGGGTTNFCDGSGSQNTCMLLPTTITSPDGKAVNLQYEFWTHCVSTSEGQPQLSTPEVPRDNAICTYTPRLAQVSSSFGYAIAFSYASAPGFGGNVAASFSERTGADFYNSNASSSALASVSYSYPASGVTDITDTGGRVWRATTGSGGYAIRRPGASSNTTSVTANSGVVSAVTREGVTTSYSRSVSGSTATMSVTNALSQTSTVVSDLTIGRPTSLTDALNRTRSFQYDTNGRLTRTTEPEGNYVQYSYDARGNDTQAQRVAKPGSGTATITMSATYAATCADPSCNQPLTTTDARGNVTDYTYDTAHGGVLTVTAPAMPNGVRPQTSYGYTLTNGEYQLTSISACQTTSSCVGTADEVKTIIASDVNGNVTSASTGTATAL